MFFLFKQDLIYIKNYEILLFYLYNKYRGKYILLLENDSKETNWIFLQNCLLLSIENCNKPK